MTSINAQLWIGRQITEPLQIHLGMYLADANRRVAGLLDLVAIP